MKAQDPNPRPRRRYVQTSDSDHDGPISPRVARDFEVHGLDRVWAADLTYIAIAAGFANVALILNALSRRVVGHALGRSLDARLAVEALRPAIAARRPPSGCAFHSDLGSQYVAAAHRALLAERGLLGPMSRRENPQDNPQAESCLKTLKVKNECLMEHETFEDVAAGSPQFIEANDQSRFHSALGVSRPRRVRGAQRPRPCRNSRLSRSARNGALPAF
ncbi:MAG: DDE-type integrase/transposase/recombinase [Pseudomonadota bacterium]